MKVAVIVPLSEITDRGKDGTGLTIALHNWGFDVHLIPTDVTVPVHPFIAQLLTKPTVPKFDLLINYSDSPVSAYLQNKSAYVVDKAEIKSGYESSIWKYTQRNWTDSHFSYCVMEGDYYTGLATEAFIELREKYPEFNNTQLNILSDRRDDYRMDVNIYPDFIRSVTNLQSFYKKQHVMLALSQDKHLSAVEFMSTGGLIIAASWGFNKEWLSPEYALSLPIRSNAQSPSGLFCNNIDKEDIKEMMWYAFSNRNEMKTKGTLASSTIPQMLDWSNVLERLFMKLGRVPKGRLVSEKALYIRAQEAHNRDEDSEPH